MIIYLMMILGVLAVIRIYQLSQQTLSFKTTSPATMDYLHFIKDAATLRTESEEAKGQLQTRFMNFIAALGTRSLEQDNSGVGYFRLPNLTPVFVLSNKEVIRQLYEKNTYLNDRQEKKIRFGQKKFFTRLAIILGQDNLMSSDLGSKTHSEIRAAILARNEAFRPQLTNVVFQFLKNYEKTEQGRPLSEIMDALSRQVLLSTYFGQTVIEQFEKLYSPQLTKELITCLFSLNKISPNEYSYLFELRNRIFEIGCQLIFSEGTKQQLMQEKSWLSYLLQIRVVRNGDFQEQLAQLGIDISASKLPSEQCERLINYATRHRDHNALSATVRDVVNESLFIPLLGFDATASVLITTLRMIVQDKRIYTIVIQEIREKLDANENFVLHSPWDLSKKDQLSYMEAVALEALRLSPPAPIVPEIINETLTLKINDKNLVLPAGALVFIPLQSLHTHARYFPDIPLSERGQKELGKKTIRATDIFPERWKPKTSSGEIYNVDLFSKELTEEVMNSTSLNPRQLEQEGSFLTFKTGRRRCPGLRIALAEVFALCQMLAFFEFKLDNEENLVLDFHYETPLQRNGGKSALKITSFKDKAAPPLCAVPKSDRLSCASGVTFFEKLLKPKPDIGQPLGALQPSASSSKNGAFMS